MSDVDVSEEQIDAMLQYDPYYQAAHTRPRQTINYDWDVPVSSVESSLPILPDSLESILTIFKQKPFGMIALLDSHTQEHFAAYMNEASEVVRGFASYATELATHKSELYQDLQDYVLHGPGSSSSSQENVELALVRTAELLRKEKSFKQDPQATLAYLKENHEALPAVKWYAKMKSLEEQEVRSIPLHGDVVASYALNKIRNLVYDEQLDKAG